MDEDRQSLETKRKILKKLKKLLEEWNGEYSTMDPDIRQYFDKVDKDLKNLEKNLKSYFEKLNKEFEIEEKEYQHEKRAKEKAEREMQEELQRQEEAGNEETEHLAADQQSAEATTATTETMKKVEEKESKKTEKEPTEATQRSKCKNDTESDDIEDASHNQLEESEHYSSSVRSLMRPSPISFQLNRTSSANHTGIVDMQAVIEGPYPSIASDMLGERHI